MLVMIRRKHRKLKFTNLYYDRSIQCKFIKSKIFCCLYEVCCAFQSQSDQPPLVNIYSSQCGITACPIIPLLAKQWVIYCPASIPTSWQWLGL